MLIAPGKPGEVTRAVQEGTARSPGRLLVAARYSFIFFFKYSFASFRPDRTAHFFLPLTDYAITVMHIPRIPRVVETMKEALPFSFDAQIDSLDSVRAARNQTAGLKFVRRDITEKMKIRRRTVLFATIRMENGMQSRV